MSDNISGNAYHQEAERQEVHKAENIPLSFANQNDRSSCPSPKSRWLAFVLCFMFGYFGVHHLYVGNKKTARLYLFTFGLCGMGWLVDMARIATGIFKDCNGLSLRY